MNKAKEMAVKYYEDNAFMRTKAVEKAIDIAIKETIGGILEVIEELLESHREFDINQMICKPFSELDLLNLKNLLNSLNTDKLKEGE